MTLRTETNHLTVTGFTGDAKTTAASKAKAGRANLREAKANVIAAKNNFSEVFEKTVGDFKTEAVLKLNETEQKIADYKKKITTANDEIGTIYQYQVDKLEKTKIALMAKLDEYKEEGEDKWDSFKHEFMDDLKNLEKSITDFVESLKK